MRWPWQKAELGYQLSPGAFMEGHQSYTEWLAAMKKASEREMAYVLSPELRPELDPYVWIDPFEDR